MCVFGKESHLIFRITTICAVRVCFDELSNGETVGRFAGGEREGFLQSRPIIDRLNPDFKIGKAEIAEIAEHISRFSLAAVTELTRQARRS